MTADGLNVSPSAVRSLTHKRISTTPLVEPAYPDGRVKRYRDGNTNELRTTISNNSNNNDFIATYINKWTWPMYSVQAGSQFDPSNYRQTSSPSRVHTHTHTHAHRGILSLSSFLFLSRLSRAFTATRAARRYSQQRFYFVSEHGLNRHRVRK